MSAETNTRRSITSLSGPALPFWRRIRTALIVYFVLLAVLPAAGTTVLITSQLRSQAREQVVDQLESVASLKVQLIDQWLIGSRAALNTITASDAEDQRFSVLTTPQAFNFEQVQASVNQILIEADESHAGFVEIFFYDLKGNIQSSSLSEDIGKSVTRQPYYTSSLANEYTQSPYYQVGSGELTTLITNPVRNINGQVIGVLAGRLNLDVLGEIMLHDTGLPHSAETYLVSAQSNYLLTPSHFEGYEMTRAYHSQGIDRALAGEDGSGTYDDYRDPPVRVFGVYRWIPELQAALVAEQNESEALQAFSDARFNGVALAIGTAVLAVLIGLAAAARFSQPIMALTHAATRIAIGDLKERATVRQRNELGVLGAAFNDMADQLQQSINLLEDRVSARTRDLFLTLEVGEMASRVFQQSDLLPRIADHIREQFDLYYTQVYLIDEAGRSAVLAAGTGEVGEQLLSRGHRLDLDATSIVALAVQTRRPVLVSNTATSPVHRPNPLLPDTRSEVAIPLQVGDEVLGVLDMQARQPETFREDNVPVFQAMANQLATSVRSAQAYAETQIAVARADALNRRLTAEAWDSYLGRVGEDRIVAYEYNLQDVRQLDSGRLPVSSNGNPRQLALPVKLRGQSIGTIQIEEETEREWTSEEKELVEDVAERLALALDQFRAFDDTQKRATEMEAVAEVGAHAAATLDPDRLLWTVSELVKARFDLYHAHIYLLNDPGDTLGLVAGAGEPGRFMVEHGHKIALSHGASLVARAARSRAGVVVNDVTSAEDFLPNPMLPRTRSEMAVPMIVGDEVIGVLDVQSERVGRFTGADLQVNTTLAAQIAVAIQNARSFSQIQKRSQNLEKEQSALVSLAQQPAFSEGDLITALQQVTLVAAQVMGVERASVWFYDHTRSAIECRMLYDQSDNAFASGVVLHRADYPGYFRALEMRGQIVADNAHTHPDTCEFSAGYLTPLNIQSMLDIPIRAGEQMIGVLCHEHVGTQRHWTLEEEAFGGSMSVMVSLALEAARRNKLQAELRKLSQAVEQNPTTVVITNLDGSIEYVNQAFVDNTGYAREEAIGQNPRMLKSGRTPADVYQQMWQTVEAGGTWQGELLNKKKSGDLFWEQVAITPIANTRGETTHYLAVKQDITDRLAAQTEREQLLEDLQRLSIRLQDRLKEISALQEIGAYSEENLALDEYLFRVARRIPPSMQHPDICGAAIEFDGQVYGDRQTAEMPSRLAVPLMVSGEQVGTVLVGYVEERDFLSEEESHLEAIAERVSTNIQSRRLFDQVEKRAVEMQAVSQVGAEAAANLNQDDLLWSVVNLVKERFGLYHAHIYLTDDRNHYLRLAAGAGEAGKQMVVQGHRISLRHEFSLAARAVRSGQPVVVNDVMHAPDFLPNPMLPLTRSELATPLAIGGRVIGVLDVQSDEPDHFTAEDIQVQSTLASQIAVAVNNAQLFTEQLEVADRLREVDRLKSEFLASMSHELRTPLNSIIGYAEVLLDGIDGDLTDDMTEDVSAIHGSGKHLLNLINDILDLAKIEAGQMDLVMEGFRLGPLAEDTASTQRVLLKDKPVDIVLDIPDELPNVRADPLRVRQVLSNLITNAIKFTEEGSITIRARSYEPDPSMLLVSVIDTGIGMRQDQLHMIFDRFRQVDQSHTRRAGGTGLGLSITRQLIQMHGGDIWVESEPGAGSRFHFTLPATTRVVER